MKTEISKRNMDISGKVAIVTGGSRGIGEAIAKALAEHGAKVIVAARKIEALQAVADEIKQAGGDATAIACHAGHEEELNKLVAETVSRYGKVDILVNNAATNPYFGPLMNVEIPAWDKTFEVNTKGYFLATRAVVRHLQERKAAGSIVNVASIEAFRAAPMFAVYAACKAGMVSFTRTMALELSEHRIRVNCIAPDMIPTPGDEGLSLDAAAAEREWSKTVLPDMGHPDDCAAAVVYLASDFSRFTTGSTLHPDSGNLASGGWKRLPNGSYTL